MGVLDQEEWEGLIGVNLLVKVLNLEYLNR